MHTIGFVGLGVMGASMARRLMAAGYSLRVFTRTRSKAEALLEQGAKWCESPGQVAENADAVLSIVGYPADVESVYLGPDAIVDRAIPGTLLVDMTTSRTPNSA